MQLKVLLIVLISFTLLSAPSQAKETLIMSGHPEFNPVMYRQDSAIIGIGAELAEIIFTELNIKTQSLYVGPGSGYRKKQNQRISTLSWGSIKTEPGRSTWIMFQHPSWITRHLFLF